MPSHPLFAFVVLGDLQLRFGLHSGPVTGGVLRGQKSRFQLFGDTVNTAARMESNGTPGKIQVTQSTADLLIAAGKGRWVKKREELIEAKGKGLMQTYWAQPNTLSPSVCTGATYSGHTAADGIHGIDCLDERTERLVNWNADIMAGLIRQIMSRRNTTKRKKSSAMDIPSESSGTIALDEVKEVIKLPDFDESAFLNEVDAELIELNPQVMTELRNFIIAVANSYDRNAFHNFEHCSHVTMSVVKLLGRIVSPEGLDNVSDSTGEQKSADLSKSLHDHTYGITSDPLTQFACVFSALIHDAGHTGVPNGQLAKENLEIATKYRHQSLAEQRSVDIAWELFMAPCYSNLHLRIRVKIQTEKPQS
jgi:hypothetical protein